MDSKFTLSPRIKSKFMEPTPGCAEFMRLKALEAQSPKRPKSSMPNRLKERVRHATIQSDNDSELDTEFSKRDFHTRVKKEFLIDHSNTFFLNKSSEMNKRRENYTGMNLSYHQVLERHRVFSEKKRK